MPLEAVHDRSRRLLDQGAPLREILAFLALSAEQLSDRRTVASILLIDNDGLLRNGASPNLPAEYLDAIDRLKPHPDLGTCAAAAATGEIVVTADFQDDRRWAELRHLPLALGFRGAWSVPIKTEGGRVLGTFGSYFFEKREPTPHERELVGVLASLAAAAILAHSLP